MREKFFKQLQREVLRKHFDAGETVFLERELTQLRAKIFETQFPDLRARTFAPKAADISPSAETFSYKVLTPVGKAKFIEYKSGDLPRVDVTAREVLGKVRPLGASYGWDINELRRAAELGMPLSELKAKTARETVERQIDEVIAFGSLADDMGNRPDVGLNGLVSSPDVVNNGIAAGSFWFAATPPAPAAVLEDLTSVVSNISVVSRQVFYPNAIILPTAHYNYVQQTPYSALTGESILSVFQKNNPGISIDPWYWLDAAGVTAKPRAIVYKKDSTVLEAIVPQEFETMPPEMRGLEFINNCHARAGGVKIYQPLAMRYIDFATS